MSDLILSAKNISKIYGEPNDRLEVLKGVNLDLYSGDLLSIRGSSGAGKSTLLQILGSLDHPTAGSVEFKGQNIFTLKDSDLDAFRLKEIGFVFQFHHLLPELSCLENILLPTQLLGVPFQEAKERAQSLMEKVGLQDRSTHLPSELSGGERQRAAIARALVNRPSLVLADEPTGNLDEANSRKLEELFCSLNEEMGQSFVLVTHDLSLANSAKRRCEMTWGEIKEL